MTEHIISSITYEDDKYLLKNAVLMSKTFENIIATANDINNGTFYFGKIIPKAWNIPLKIRYRVRVYCPSSMNYNQYADVSYFIIRDTATYALENIIYSSSYRSAYYHNLYRAKEAGITKYGHLLGESIYNSTNPTNTSYKRTFEFEILELENCTFEFFDTPVLYANAPGTGSTNYTGRTDYNFTGNGLYPDSNTVTQTRIESRLITGSNGVKQYSIMFETADGKVESLTIGSGNGTDKQWYTNAKIPYPPRLYYYAGSSNIAAGSVIGTSATYLHNSVIDMRYSDNITSSVGYTINKPLYLECSFDTNGFITIGENPYKQTFTKGKYYIFLGWVHTDVYRLSLMNAHVLYYYDGTNLIPYDKYTYATKDHSHDDATTTTSGFMSSADKTKLDGIAEGATKTEASTTNGKIKINGTDTSVYTHPSYTAKSSGFYKVTVDNTGHVSAATAVAKADITALGIPGSDTTYSAGTGLSLSGTTFNHSNSVTAITTAGFYKLKYDAQGHITGTTAVVKSDITGLGIPGSDTTYSAGTGLSLSGTTFNHSNSITAVTTAGLYKVKYDAQGHITGTSAITKADITGLGIPGTDTDTTYSAGTGLSLSGTTFNHSNSVTAITTAGLYKVKYDAQGHITGTTSVAKADITSLGIPGSDTTYSAGTGLSLSGTTFNHSNSVTALSEYKNIYVTYDAQGHVTGSRNYVHVATGTDGQAGWIKVANLKIIGIYANAPLVLSMVQRGNSPFKVNIQFNNVNNLDPSLTKFFISSDREWTSNNFRAYIKKVDTSSWDLFVIKGDTYDGLTVLSVEGRSNFNTKVKITWKNEQISSDAIVDGTEAEKHSYAALSHGHTYLDGHSQGTRLTSANLPTATNGNGAIFGFVATSTMTEGKPPTVNGVSDAHILQMNWDNNGGYDSQIAVYDQKNIFGFRSQSGGTWGNWATIYADTSTGNKTYNLDTLAGKSTVSISRSLTSGTKIGTITIDGTATDLYCQTNTNTDTLVKQTVDTSSTTASPILVRANPSSGSATAGEAKYVSNVNVKASTGTLTATEYSVNSKVTMKYDTSIDAVKFVFA